MRAPNGKAWIVCTDRLIPAKTNTITPYHIAALNSVAQTLFPGIYSGDVGYRRQVSITVGKGKRVVLDYVLDARPANHSGPDKVILEIQGGGETSSTGEMTKHVARWAKESRPTNVLLRQSLPKVGIIPNNAWKRQLEQIGRKYAVAKRFGGAFALVMGEVFFAYVRSLFPQDCPYFPEWEIAFVSLSETESKLSGSIPIDNVSEAIFMTYDNFVNAVIGNYPLPSVMSDPFDGIYTTFRNEEYQVKDGKIQV